MLILLSCVLLAVLLASSVQGLRIPSKLAAIGVGLSIMLPSYAAVATQEIGNIPTTGFVFKDYLRVNEIPDPKIKGISVYIADFDRPVTDKLSNVFDDPSSSSISCAQTGPIEITSDISTSKEGEDIFTENKNIFFKQIKVKRLYDKERNTVVYASYSLRFDKNSDDNKSRFKSSLCAVTLH